VEQPPRTQRHPGDRELPDGAEEAAKTLPHRALAGDGHVGTVAEDGVDQPAEHRAGPGLQEHPGSRGVHRLDLAHEPDRCADLRGELGAHRVGVRRVDRRGAVRPHRVLGRPDPVAGQHVGELRPCSGQQGAVERTRHGDLLGREPGRAELVERPVDQRGRP
jgi:hypothetical protein